MTLFNVAHKRIKLRVRLLPTVADVDAEAKLRTGLKVRRGHRVHAYFQPTSTAGAEFMGTVVFPLNGRLDELVPHEVTNGVIHHMRAVSANDDEAAATAVGMLSAKIFKQIKQYKTAA